MACPCLIEGNHHNRAAFFKAVRSPLFQPPQDALMHRFFADLSRLLSRLTGGAPNTTLCHRAAMQWGWDCAFCKLVALILSDKNHCLDELSASEIVALKRRRKK